MIFFLYDNQNMFQWLHEIVTIIIFLQILIIPPFGMTDASDFSLNIQIFQIYV